MRQDAQKQSRKFCRSKEGKKSKMHPKSSKKGETGCVLGAGEGGSGWRRMKPGEKTRKARRKSRDGLVSAAASVGAGRSPQATSAPRHALRRAQPCLVAKTFRPVTKNSATAKAVAPFLAGAEGLGLGCRLGRRWTVATGDQRPTTLTAGGPAGAPCCQILPHTNEKVRYRRSDT